jgi:hypothetical protein
MTRTWPALDGETVRPRDADLVRPRATEKMRGVLTGRAPRRQSSGCRQRAWLIDRRISCSRAHVTACAASHCEPLNQETLVLASLRLCVFASLRLCGQPPLLNEWWWPARCRASRLRGSDSALYLGAVRHAIAFGFCVHSTRGRIPLPSAATKLLCTRAAAEQPKTGRLFETHRVPSRAVRRR